MWHVRKNKSSQEALQGFWTEQMEKRNYPLLRCERVKGEEEVCGESRSHFRDVKFEGF